VKAFPVAASRLMLLGVLEFVPGEISDEVIVVVNEVNFCKQDKTNGRANDVERNNPGRF
jgi:hypothetical protein